ncbi:MAG: TIGR02391 family protein [Candidatus Poribacteria bacterium]|nr:TIGR02391 family protein [Candidatus Poribacteria bacterium]
MQIFSKLFKILPDADHLLSLEPEILARPLLISLENSDNIPPIENIIGYDPMVREIEEGISRGNPNLNYPPGSRDKVLFALMEAWQWLEREGFVAPRPLNLARSQGALVSTRYFVTRRGQRVKTSDDLKSYQKANLLPKAQLHPIIAQKVWSLFLQGDFDTAVFQAFKQVEVAVRETGYYANTELGYDLMRAAFHPENGALTDPSQHPAEKQARSDLFAGAIGSYKNPSSHRNVEMTAEEAVELIFFASHLRGIVDSRHQSDGDWQKQFANGFLRHLKVRKSPLMDPEVFMGENARGYPRYIGFNIGKIENLDMGDRKAFWLVASTTHGGKAQGAKIYLKLHMNDSNDFSQLKSQKAEIEDEFGDQLKWEPQGQSQHIKIGVDLEVTPLDENRRQWNQYFEAMREKLEKIYEIFPPRIETLVSEDDIPF